MISEVQGEVQGLMKSDEVKLNASSESGHVMLSRFDASEAGTAACEESTNNQKAAVEKAEEYTAAETNAANKEAEEEDAAAEI